MDYSQRFLFDTYDILYLPPNQMRYNTIADWTTSAHGSALTIYIPENDNPLYSWLLAKHETIEAEVCQHLGITQEAVDSWDIAFEAARQNIGPAHYTLAECGCRIDVLSEPGDDAHCPYRQAHTIADTIELSLATEFNVDWDDYLEWIDGLFETVQKARKEASAPGSRMTVEKPMKCPKCHTIAAFIHHENHVHTTDGDYFVDDSWECVNCSENFTAHDMAIIEEENCGQADD